MSGKPVKFAPYEFRVKSLPIPVAKFAGKSSGSVAKNLAMAQVGVFAVLENFDFDLVYKVTGFSVLYSSNQGDFEEQSNSQNLTQKQKDLISRLTRGRYLTIKDIKAVGPDGKTNDLPPVILRID